MSDALLQVEMIEVVYKRVITAVQGVTLSVGPKQIVAILGINGAGKTTTLRAISGFLGLDDARVTEGMISFEGRRIENAPPHDIAARGIVLVPERDKVFPNLTVAENLAVPVSRASAAERRRQDEQIYSLFPRLAELRQRIGGLLSGGERQMLAIAGALMCRPSLLLVDELSLGLAPVVVDTVYDGLREINRNGTALVVVEQQIHRVLELATWAVVLDHGAVAYEGEPSGAGAVVESLMQRREQAAAAGAAEAAEGSG